MTRSSPREIGPGWIAAGVLGLAVVLLLFFKASESVAPKPVALWVGIEPEDTGKASVGPVSVPAGTLFDLHAVIEAETFAGERIYYTEAERLDFRGEEVPTESLRRWSRGGDLRILWFTVEGVPAFREIAAGELSGGPRFKESFRADWGQAWRVPGDLRPVVENYLPGEEQVRREPRFGVQRFHLRIEFFENRGDLVPELRLSSWGAEELLERSAEFPSVFAHLPGPLEAPSRVFGLPQLEPAAGSRSAAVDAGLAEWNRQRLAFSRITVLADWLKSQKSAMENLDWKGVDVAVSGTPAHPGDLLRVGNRIVWVLEDRGDSGRLDYDDLCLDFDRGARVRRLGEVFSGEGLVGWAAARPIPN